jgi:hypothetical protein
MTARWHAEKLFGIAAAALSLIVSGPLAAAPHTYTYAVEHPSYGNIGTYIDTVDEEGDNRRIDTKLRVVVTVAGIVVFRETADRTETWVRDRLVSFDSVTTTNGDAVAVRGEAREDGFAITSAAGTIMAPLNVYTSSPWSVVLPHPEIMMSTKNGKVERVQVLSDGVTSSSIHGTQMQLRHYEILSDKRQDVWCDPAGVPVHFRTQESEGPVDFVLKSQRTAG